MRRQAPGPGRGGDQHDLGQEPAAQGGAQTQGVLKAPVAHKVLGSPVAEKIAVDAVSPQVSPPLVGEQLPELQCARRFGRVPSDHLRSERDPGVTDLLHVGAHDPLFGEVLSWPTVAEHLGSKLRIHLRGGTEPGYAGATGPQHPAPAVRERRWQRAGAHFRLPCAGGNGVAPRHRRNGAGLGSAQKIGLEPAQLFERQSGALSAHWQPPPPGVDVYLGEI